MASYTRGAASVSHTATQSVSLGVATADVTATVSAAASFRAGTAANEANRSGSAVLVPGGVDVDVDLSGGTHLDDGDGGTIAFTAVKAFTARAPATNAGPVTVSTTLANGWSTGLNGTVSLAPGACLTLLDPSAAGIAVAAGTGDLVRFAGAGTDAVHVIVTGKS